ncbi:MAG: translation initiation factor [Puniceicoccales bacterium]|jgi:translation initiation factor 1|nr:translation initiation factor [Puniceicoccales bacterium]
MTGKIPTHGGGPLDNKPFAALDLGALPPAPVRPPAGNPAPPSPKRGKVHLRMERTGRGGKTVTVLFGPGIARLDESGRQALLRSLKTALGVGGTTGPGDTLEIQGDERLRLPEQLRRAGFPS